MERGRDESLPGIHVSIAILFQDRDTQSITLIEQLASSLSFKPSVALQFSPSTKAYMMVYLIFCVVLVKEDVFTEVFTKKRSFIAQ